MALWKVLNGKKTYVGYAGIQAFGPDNILTAISDATVAWLQALKSKDFTPVVQPTLNLLAQVLLLVGVGDRAVKEVKELKQS